MSFFNRDEFLAQTNKKITQLENKLSTALSKIDSLVYSNRELKSKVEKLTEENNILRIENKALKDENEQLKKRLKIDSTNSSMSPSTNRFSKPTVSNRNPSDKKAGGQDDHKGGKLEFSAIPTDKEEHKPKECGACGGEFVAFNLVDTRQVRDIITTEKITNHYIYAGVCNCGCETTFASDIPHGVSYGNNLKSMILYLHNKDFIPSNRLSETIVDLFGISVSEGTIYNWQNELSTNLNQYEDAIIERLYKETTLHADESGLKVNKLTMWLHVISNKYFTYYDVHKKRGMEAMVDTGILPNYSGNLVHDCFKSYHNLEKINQHGLCNAHLLRELKSMDQFYKLRFANKLRDLLLNMNKSVTDKTLTYQIKLQFKAEFKKLIILARSEAATLTNEKWQKDVIALANRLTEHGSKYLGFLDNSDIPFTNNQAEQDIRMIKVKQKISGGFRTKKGAENFIKIRGFISTMRKQGQNIIDTINKIIQDPSDYEFQTSC